MSFDSSYDINAIISQLARDRGIDKKVLVEAIESAVLSAARKQYGHSLNLETQLNEETGAIEVVQFKTVVENPEDPDTQLSLEEAKRTFDPDAQIGDEIGKKLDTEVLGRIAAQTAKQVIMQKFRDAERDVIFEEFKNSKGDLINGIFQRYDRGNVIVNLGRTEGVMPKREQIGKERYRQGDRIRAMILDIDRSARGPQIVLTRSHPDFVRKLFSLEVPEIADGTIEIKEVAREPGERAKIAVVSSDGSVDPVGACVGVKGSRVQAVVQELRGERIDIITWTPDEPSFVAKALQPAEVLRVVLDDENHSMEVIVADDNLALAIGRRGQNVKLASKLTGWRIDVRSVSIVEEETKRIRKALEAIPGIEFTHAEILFQEGFGSAREVADSSVDELKAIAGIGEDNAQKILASARSYIEKLDSEGKTENLGSATDLSDLGKLSLDPAVREMVMNAGYKTIQSLVTTDNDQLLQIAGMTEDTLTALRQATDTFLRGAPRPMIQSPSPLS